MFLYKLFLNSFFKSVIVKRSANLQNLLGFKRLNIKNFTFTIEYNSTEYQKFKKYFIKIFLFLDS